MLNSGIINNARNNIKPDVKKFVTKKFTILKTIHQALDDKNMTLQELSNVSGIEYNKLIEDLQPGTDISLRTLCKIEVALNINLY